MPAFAPLATNNDKKDNRFDLDRASLWSENTDDSLDSHNENQNLSCCCRHQRISSKQLALNVFNSQIGHYVKLLVLVIIAFSHIMFINSYIEKFAAVDKLASEADIRIPAQANPKSTRYADLYTIQFTMRAFMDYKKNLWMTVGAMCASLATTASILLLKTPGQWNPMNRAHMIMIRFIDATSFFMVGALLFTRIHPAVTIRTFTNSVLTLSNGFISLDQLTEQFNCSVLPKEDLPLCNDIIVGSIFPVKLIEYLIILCLLTGAYIALAYLIEWCIRHFFPPSSHTKMSPIRAISRSLNQNCRSQSMFSVDENILVSP